MSSLRGLAIGYATQVPAMSRDPVTTDKVSSSLFHVTVTNLKLTDSSKTLT